MLRFHFPQQLTALGLGLLALFCASTPSRAAPVKLPSDLQFVQDTNLSFVSVKPQALLDSEFLRAMPKEMRREFLPFAQFEKEMGVPVADIERLTILLSPKNPLPVVVLRGRKQLDHEKIVQRVIPDAKRSQHRGKTIYSRPRGGPPSLCVLDTGVILMGWERSIRAALDAAAKKGDPLLEDAIGFATKGHHLVLGGTPMLTAFGVFGGVRAGGRWEANEATKEAVPLPEDGPPPLPPGADGGDTPGESGPGAADPFQIVFQPDIDDLGPEVEPRFEMPSMKELLDDMPAEMLPYKPLFLAKTWAVGLTLGKLTSVEWKLRYPNKVLAEDGEIAVRTLFYVMRETLPMMSRELLDRDPSESPQLAAFFTQVKTALRAAPIENEGTNLSGKILLRVNAETITALTVEMRKRALETTSSNNLKQIGVAMHNFEATHLGFPAAAITDKQGKPLLSWRVAILPYVEQEQLYKQFKLDEPWDSEHNKKLLAKMPKLFEPVANKPKKAYSTYYRVFVGPGTVFDPRWARRPDNRVGARFLNITDGTSNTFLVVESSESVEWTKPEPLTFDPKKAVPKLGGMFTGGFQALMADGSVQFLKNSIDPGTLRILIQAQDGRASNWRRFSRDGDRGYGSGATAPDFGNDNKPIEGKPTAPDVVPGPPPVAPGPAPRPVRDKPAFDKPAFDKPRDR